MRQIAIIGAGLIGRLLSLIIAKEARVYLYERTQLDDENNLLYLAGGMIAPATESLIANEKITNMGYHSLQLWLPLLQYLQLPNDIFHQQGSLIVAHNKDISLLNYFYNRIKKTHHVSRESQTTLLQLEPQLNQQFNEALFLPCEGHINNHLLHQATTEKIKKNNNIILHENTSCHVQDDAIILKNQKKQYFDFIFDCRGLGAKNNLIDTTQLLRGVRGEIISIYNDEIQLSRPIRVMHPRYPLYIVPKSANIYTVGATEIESSDITPPSVRSVMELLSALYMLNPAFSESRVLSIKTGLRPTLIDGEPSIFRHNNTIQINGLYRHGFMLAPYLIHYLLSMLKNDHFQSFSHHKIHENIHFYQEK